jgi:hypothetical protein
MRFRCHRGLNPNLSNPVVAASVMQMDRFLALMQTHQARTRRRLQAEDQKGW